MGSPLLFDLANGRKIVVAFVAVLFRRGHTERKVHATQTTGRVGLLAAKLMPFNSGRASETPAPLRYVRRSNCQDFMVMLVSIV